jgi:hypothetical protein
MENDKWKMTNGKWKIENEGHLRNREPEVGRLLPGIGVV